MSVMWPHEPCTTMSDTEWPFRGAALQCRDATPHVVILAALTGRT